MNILNVNENVALGIYYGKTRRRQIMRLSQLATKQLIDMKEGKKYGQLEQCECIIDAKNGQIVGFQMRDNPTIFKKQEDPIFIKWEHITLVGKDRILFQARQTESD
jgi:YlmC/YmxH family sporulation protein